MAKIPISNVMRGGNAGKGPRGYVRSDERIKEDVSDRLSMDDETDASDITVTVSQGEVTLEGTVPDRHSESPRGSLDPKRRTPLDPRPYADPKTLGIPQEDECR